jgi:hypothetical protein
MRLALRPAAMASSLSRWAASAAEGFIDGILAGFEAPKHPAAVMPVEHPETRLA